MVVQEGGITMGGAAFLLMLWVGDYFTSWPWRKVLAMMGVV